MATDPFDAVSAVDPELADVLRREVARQNTTIQLIASENFTSPAVLAAQGSVLTNKYSEGYPGKRYYGGNYVVDDAEELARQRVCALFGADHANVQPHSGANANMGVYLALLEPGDKVMGMRLDQGGHLTWPLPYADVVTFTTHKTMRGPRGGAILCQEEYAKAIDKAVFPGMQGGPLMHVIAAKAVCFHEAAQPEFRDYADGIVRNARAPASALAGEGFRIVSGGTDDHLMLVDLRPFGVTGQVAQEALDRAGITLNKNTIPNDPESPFVTSGLRIGTAAVTTAGMGENEMAEIASPLARVLRATDDEATAAEVREASARLCSKFVPYPG